MNRQRRKLLTQIGARAESELQTLLEELMEELDAVVEEEQEAYDNLPDSLQDSERGEDMLNGLNALEEAKGYLDDWAGQISDMIDALNTASGQ